MTSHPSVDEPARTVGAAAVPWMAALYAAVMVLYLVAPPLRPGGRYALSLGGACVALAVLALVLRRAPARYAHGLLSIAAVFAFAQALSFVAFSGDPGQTVVLVIVIIGAGCVSLSLVALALPVTAAVAAWLVIAADFSDLVRAHWLTNLASSAGVSLLICWSRIRATRTMVRQADDLAQARDEALAAARTKSEFLTNVSHELRTPLNGILGTAQLLIDSELTEDQRDNAYILRESGESLLRIINDLLDLSRLDAGKTRVEPVDFCLAEDVDAAVRLLVPHARASGLELRCEVDPALPVHVHGDSERIRQVLLNLIGNAIKFTDAGSVTVRVRPGHNERVRFEIADTGAGIAARDIARMFEPFAQADGSASRRHGGTGLGLSISRSLIELMGGELGVDSELGTGSTFWFELPLGTASSSSSRRRAMARRRPTPRPSPIPGVTPRLLVAEDNEINRRVVEKMLDRLGFDADFVTDGGGALAALAEKRYSAVLMDCQMPGVDGYEATRQIRADEASRGARRLPVIALTADAMPGTRQRCLDAGMDEHLTKPIRTEALADTLARFGVTPGPPAA